MKSRWKHEVEHDVSHDAFMMFHMTSSIVFFFNEVFYMFSCGMGCAEWMKLYDTSVFLKGRRSTATGEIWGIYGQGIVVIFWVLKTTLKFAAKAHGLSSQQTRKESLRSGMSFRHEILQPESKERILFVEVV